MFGKLDLHIARAGLSPVLVYTVRGPQGEPVRVLSSGGVFQSATYLGERRMEPVFEYYRAFGRVLDGIAVPAPRVLVVGGGGFAVPKLARASRPETTIEVVEIDPKVIDAARRWFYADEAASTAPTGSTSCAAQPCAASSTTLSRSTPSRAQIRWRRSQAPRPSTPTHGCSPPAAPSPPT